MWLLLAVTACSESKPDFSRFIVRSEVSGITVTVAGRPIPLTKKANAYGQAEYDGMIDFKESEVSSKTIPVITMMTPCGPKPVELKAGGLSPPNESNVVVVNLSRHVLPKATTFVFAPSVKGPVTIGDIAVPTPIPREMTVFDAGCGKPITIGSESSPIERENTAMIVAPSTSACLKTGVALYGSGPGCQPESSRRLTGKLLYGMPEVPSIRFEGVDHTVKSTGKCSNRTWVQEC
jgi:hypothetical protein